MRKLTIDVPQSLIDVTANTDSGLGYKSMVSEVFMAFFESERFKKYNDPDAFTTMFEEFSRIVDQCILAHQNTAQPQDFSHLIVPPFLPEAQNTKTAQVDPRDWPERIEDLKDERQALIQDLFMTMDVAGWVELLTDLFMRWHNEMGAKAAEPYRSNTIRHTLHLPVFIAALGGVEQEIQLFSEKMKGGVANG